MKFLYSFVAILLCGNLFAQQFNYFEGQSNLKANIDTSLSTNIWAIGSPNKEIFDAAFSAPNAIVTDTLNDYSVPNQSRFSIVINSEEALSAYPYLITMFWHKMDVDMGHAGGWIEASYDGGMSWANIYSDTIAPLVVIDYSPIDTLFNGEIGYTSNHTDWRLSTICWGVLAHRETFPQTPDSIMLMFNFAADSVAVPAEGWIIDNIEVYPEIIHTVEELRAMATGEAMLAFPNPSSDHVNLFFRLERTSRAILQLVAMDGTITYSEDLGLVQKGIYNHRLEFSDHTKASSFAVARLRLEGRSLIQKIIISSY